MRSTILACLLALTTLGVAPATPARDRAHDYLVRRVADALVLSGDAERRMSEVLRRADERRLELAGRRDALDAKLRAALAASPVDTPALGVLVADAQGVQRELAALPAHTFDEARKILTVEQQAKLLLFRRELQGEVRQAIRKRGTPESAAHHAK
jgi:hypothetical protein